MNKLLVSKGELFYLVIIHVGNQVVNIENACNSVWTHFSIHMTQIGRLGITYWDLSICFCLYLDS